MRKLASLLLLCLLVTLPAFADDSAASIGAGGLVVLKNEKRIAMAKEVLTIGLKKVHVDYEFQNDTADNVSTLVAFPIPAYQFSEDMSQTIAQSGFDDFKLMIEGKPATFSVEALAKVNGADLSALLKADHIDIGSFGHYDFKTDASPDLKKLSAAQMAALVKAGAIDTNAGQPGVGTADNPVYIHPSWTVEKKYYWTQNFPAHSTVHISHEYTPAAGYTLVGQSDFIAVGPNPTPDELKDYGADNPILPLLRSVCLDEPLRQQLITAPFGKDMGTYRRMNYVDFILTTANTWKQPIYDFTLLVERPAGASDPKLISFCWPSPVTKVSANEFKATATNLVPTSELRVGFFAL
jgi:hypothetical protein